MLYCDEYDKDCSEVTSDECDNGCCDSCMYCVICTDEEWNEDLLGKEILWIIESVRRFKESRL